MIEPVTVVVVLNTSPAAAFDAFVAKIDSWWPVENFSIAKGTVSVEPELGGRIIETASDGTEHVWGSVTRWDAPHHLSIRWSVGEDATPTAITLDFAATDDGRTGVTLVHTGWEALGEDGVAKRANYQMGWDRILGEAYARFARATCPPLTEKVSHV